MKKYIIIGSLVVLLASAAVFYKKQLDLLQQYETEIMGIKIVKLSLDTSIINIKVRLHSQSTLQAEITELNLDFYMNGVFMAKIKDVRPVIIPAKGYSDIEVAVEFSPNALGKDAVALVSNLIKFQDADIRINGFGKVRSAFIKINVPITYDTTLKQYFSS